MSKVAPYAKAVVGAIVAALGVLGGFLVNDTAVGDVTAGQWVAVAVAFFVAFGAIFAVPNSSPS
jgi:hypothetical protein